MKFPFGLFKEKKEPYILKDGRVNLYEISWDDLERRITETRKMIDGYNLQLKRGVSHSDKMVIHVAITQKSELLRRLEREREDRLKNSNE